LSILGRITARWLVGLLVVLIVLAHVSDAGRTARSGYDFGQAVLSPGERADPVLVSEAPQVDIRFRGGDKQPLVGSKPAGDAVLPNSLSLVPSGTSRTPHAAQATTHVRMAWYVPGQRAPPTEFPKA
jgi:hypothetical protein